MLEVSDDDIRLRIQRDNPWWQQGREYKSYVSDYKKRFYFKRFCELATDLSVRRATVLMGPRRVGKTVMVRQLIDTLIKKGVEPTRILFASIDAPVFANLPLEKYLSFLPKPPQASEENETHYVLFDEIQYLKNWEVHLKDLVDNYPSVRFIATGSAAAALKLASRESGAGRFSDFRLPPLTFAEFLDFIEENSLVELSNGEYVAKDLPSLNNRFIDYLNFGGYPEAVLSPTVRTQQDQFVKNDIIDKVLLKDLPALYGIKDIQELNSLFAHLAYNTGQELSLQTLSQHSGLSKPTIQKYIEYLESAFLIVKVSRIDVSAKRFKKEMTFKVYLTNPSMRAALFAPVEEQNTALVGHLTESAIFSQWSHDVFVKNLFYARWSDDKEVDMICLAGADFRPTWAVEIKWSDRAAKNPERELRNLAAFLRKNKLEAVRVTTKEKTGSTILEGHNLEFVPSSVYCYTVGKNVSANAAMILAKGGQKGGKKE